MEFFHSEHIVELIKIAWTLNVRRMNRRVNNIHAILTIKDDM